MEDLSYCSQYRPISYPFNRPVSQFCSELDITSYEEHQRQRESLRHIYGPNLISIPLPGPLQLLLDEVLHPFYMFQLFSVVLWYVEVYATYATAIIIISVTGAVIGVLQTRKNLINLKKLAEYECNVELYDLATKTQKTISSKNLVPGDIIAVQEGLIMPCDVILLQGKCVVNESMLTGESVPVVKSPADTDDKGIFTPSKSAHAKYTLYGGTEVLQTKTLDKPEVKKTEFDNFLMCGLSGTGYGVPKWIFYHQRSTCEINLIPEAIEYEVLPRFILFHFVLVFVMYAR